MKKTEQTIGMLRANERNPRKISAEQKRMLKAALAEFGDLGGFVFNRRTQRLVGGHQRQSVIPADSKIKILRQYSTPSRTGTMAEGFVTAHGERFSYREVEWTEKRERMAMVAANKIQGEFDDSKLPILLSDLDESERLLVGFTEEDQNALGIGLDPEEPEDAEPQINRAAELNKKWKVKPGDLWQIGEHRLLCGDSTKREDVEYVMGGDMARMCFTDPPWNVAIGQDSNPRHRQRAGLQNDDLSAKDFSAFLSGFASLIPSVVTGDLYCVLGALEWPTLDLALRGTGFHWSATVIWVKDLFMLGRSKYHRRYEPIWYGWHENGKSSFGDARDLDDVWEIKRPRVSEEHPTMKPVELVIRAVNNSSRPGDTVFDPFLGSGTTMVAAENLKRRCFGIEISPDYCAVVLQRMTDAFLGIKTERIGTATCRPSQINK
jgi:DNA modification methylase